MTPFFRTRRKFLSLAAASSAAAFELPGPRARSYWLFRLLRPECIIVHATVTARLHCSDPVRQWIVEGNQAICVTKDAVRTRISGPNDSPVFCTLEVPGVMRRSFFGVFDIRGGPEYVIPVVTMDCETATNCIVGAELPVFNARFHAMAAQAVVSRSVILGTRSPRHAIADFCDTTHCQFLRSPGQRNSVVAQAVEETSGYVLVENGSVMPGRYCGACGGQTESGFDNGHRYISVRCEVCCEKGTARRGHGWGLCQEGAIGLARQGFTWRAILARYYPNAVAALGCYLAPSLDFLSCCSFSSGKTE